MNDIDQNETAEEWSNRESAKLGEDFDKESEEIENRHRKQYLSAINIIGAAQSINTTLTKTPRGQMANADTTTLTALLDDTDKDYLSTIPTNAMARMAQIKLPQILETLDKMQEQSFYMIQKEQVWKKIQIR